MDPYRLTILLVGLTLLGAVWLPHALKRQPLTFPIVYIALGAALYALPLPLPPADPVRHRVVTEHLAELTVIVALLGAGVRIDTRFGWRRWRITWRLLALAMPLCIGITVLLGQHLLGLGLASAVLLGAVLAPTDPVLASDVQVHGPGEGGEDPVRFGLTSEAGLNDGLAFPFVWLAIALATAAATGAPMDWGRWLALDVLWRVGGGVAIGALLGYGLMHLIFRIDRDDAIARGSDGLTALAITLLVYGLAELCHAYGFVAVFVAALVVRQGEHRHPYHASLNLFAEQCERLLTALVLLLFGGALAEGVLGDVQAAHVVFALALVLVVRPGTAWLSLAGVPLSTAERAALAVFGVRGIGSIYYLAFAAGLAPFTGLDTLWSVVSLVIVLSVLLHGLSAKPVMAWLDRMRTGRRRMPKPPRRAKPSAPVPAAAADNDRTPPPPSAP